MITVVNNGIGVGNVEQFSGICGRVRGQVDIYRRVLDLPDIEVESLRGYKYATLK
jgi:hypothetical protein